jgi:hypothetical protein
MSPVAMCLEELIPSNHSKSYIYSILIRTALVVSTLLVGLSVPFFGKSCSISLFIFLFQFQENSLPSFLWLLATIWTTERKKQENKLVVNTKILKKII